MKRRIIAVFIVLIIILSNCAFVNKADSYNKTLRVGLRNMFSSSIDIILNGDYLLDGDLIPTGTSFTLTLSNGVISYNGMTYNDMLFTPVNPDTTIRLMIGAKKYNYRGSMDFTIKNSGILPINLINIEDYLKGVVGYEMSNSYPIEALKAQAVAARNYAIANFNKHGTEGYDVCDTTDCQVYKGFNPAYTNVTRAVDDTKGIVLEYNGELICAYYSASSGGYLEASGNIWKYQLPYLIAKKDDYENEDWPYGNRTFKTSDIDNSLKTKNYLKKTEKFEKIDIDSIKRNESGRVQSLDILYLNANGVESRKSISKEGTRTFLSLPSSLFNVAYDESTDIYTFSGKGYGHGVGMSQIGAKNRANSGQKYDAILTFYYDGTSLKKIGSDIDDIKIIEEPETTPSSIEEPQSNVPVPGLETGGAPNTDDSSAGVKGNNGGTPGKDSGGSAVKNNNPSPVYTRVLKKGMTGDDVKRLQDSLKVLKYLNISKTTNYYGTSTESAVKAFQKKQGIDANGIADITTLSLINNEFVTNSSKKNDTKNIAQGKTANAQTGAKDSTANPKTQAPVKDSTANPKKPTTIKSSTTNSKTQNTTKDSISNSNTQEKAAANKVLKKGMQGDDIKYLQNALKSLGYFKDKITGFFGSGTENAVKLFQKSNGIVAKGTVDTKTMSRINEKLSLVSYR